MIISTGLFDLQVNGYAGVDFNDSAVTAAAMDSALEAMLAAGVTQCLPALITAHSHELRERFLALDAAVAASRLGPRMVPGYHLEGPFLNPAEGYAGCHPPGAMTDPDIGLIDRLEAELRRPILLVTLAPERAGGAGFITGLAQRGKASAMAHSSAGFADVAAAAEAGMTLSTISAMACRGNCPSSKIHCWRNWPNHGLPPASLPMAITCHQRHWRR